MNMSANLLGLAIVFSFSTVVLAVMYKSIIRIEIEKESPMLVRRRKWLTLRGVQVALGLLWLLDGLLQLQPKMFTKAFVTQVIDPAAEGQPHFIASIMHAGAHVFLISPGLFNALAALTQLSLGALILYRPTIKIGLIGSVLWGTVVWIFGEGFGGIFSGHTLLLMGAPGAAIIYVMLALAVMPAKKAESKKRKTNPQVAFWLVFAWMIIWAGGAVYQMLPGQNTTADVSSIIRGMSDGAPSWLASVDNSSAKYVRDLGSSNKTEAVCSSGSSMNMSSAQMVHMSNQSCVTEQTNSSFWFILLLAGLQIFIGFGALFSGYVRTLAISFGVALSLIFWVVGESLGGYFTGLSTDPNTGPLLVLLGFSILGCNNLDQKLSKLDIRIERLAIGKPSRVKSA